MLIVIRHASYGRVLEIIFNEIISYISDFSLKSSVKFSTSELNVTLCDIGMYYKCILRSYCGTIHVNLP